MVIRFVRIVGQPDRIYVKRSNGTEAAWEFPTFGSEIPHDMMPLVVETKFGLRNVTPAERYATFIAACEKLSIHPPPEVGADSSSSASTTFARNGARCCRKVRWN